jgi:hypothetical protein
MTFRSTLGFPGLPSTQGFAGSIESPGFAPTPTTAETLRHMADIIIGNDVQEIVCRHILHKVAKELEDWEWLREHHNDIDAPILVCYDSEKHTSLEAAIDAARKSAEGGV